MKKPSLPLIIFLSFSALIIVPLFFMIYGSIVPSFVSHVYSIKYLVQAFTSPTLPGVLINTAEFAVGGALLSIILGTPLAWLMARTDIVGRRLMGTLSILRLTIPLIVEAFSWIFLFSPQIGLANIAIERLFGINYPIFNIYSIWGLILAWGVGGIPFAFLTLEPAFRNVDPSLEEASRASGASVFRTFFSVTLPAVIPAILSVFVLLALLGAENFDYPLILGQNAHITTMATLVYNFGNLNEYSLASAYGIIYLMITMTTLAGYIWATRKSFRYVTVGATAVQRSPMRLGKWRWPAFVYVLLVFILSFALPIAVVGLISFTTFYFVSPTTNPFTSFTLSHYFFVTSLSFFRESVINSFLVTVAAAGATTILGAVLSYIFVKGKERGKSIIYFLSHISLGFSSVVYSVALIWTFLVIPGLSNLYGTMWVMLIALTVVWLPFSIRIIAPSMAQLSNALEESAAVLGAGWGRRFIQITLPLIKSAIVNSFIYVMVDSFRELGPVILLYTSQSIMLIIFLEQLWSAGRSFPDIAALSMLMIAMLTISVGVVRVIGRTRFQQQF